MSLPVKDDPRRPLYLAIRSSRVVGFVIIAIAWLLAAVQFLGLIVGGKLVNGVVVGIFVLGGVGVAYLFFASEMKKHDSRALIGCLVLNSIMLLLFTTALLEGIYQAFTSGDVKAFGLGFITLFVLAFGNVESNLISSFDAVKRRAS
jgi:hypothetical protein